jgi:hypothetical protein
MEKSQVFPMTTQIPPMYKHAGGFKHLNHHEQAGTNQHKSHKAHASPIPTPTNLGGNNNDSISSTTPPVAASSTPAQKTTVAPVG